MADRYFAEASFDIEPGEYLLELTSDDGARLFLDGKRLIDHWNIHEPATDEVRVRLGGHHRLEVEHFDGGGFGTLGMRWKGGENGSLSLKKSRENAESY